MNRALRIAAASLALFAGQAAAVDAFRCGHRLVTDGDPAAKVLALCGEPTEVRRSAVLRRPVVWIRGRPYHLSDDLVEIPIEVWTYNLGPQKLMRELRFEDGVLVEVTTLGPGYHEPGG